MESKGTTTSELKNHYDYVGKVNRNFTTVKKNAVDIEMNRTDINKIYKFYCQRISSLFYLIWKYYKDRVQLTLTTAEQFEGLLIQKSKVKKRINFRLRMTLQWGFFINFTKQ